VSPTCASTSALSIFARTAAAAAGETAVSGSRNPAERPAKSEAGVI
jgi:hypothetical protein